MPVILDHPPMPAVTFIDGCRVRLCLLRFLSLVLLAGVIGLPPWPTRARPIRSGFRGSVTRLTMLRNRLLRTSRFSLQHKFAA
jgi:hypothetical protein